MAAEAARKRRRSRHTARRSWRRLRHGADRLPDSYTQCRCVYLGIRLGSLVLLLASLESGVTAGQLRVLAAGLGVIWRLACAEGLAPARRQVLVVPAGGVQFVAVCDPAGVVVRRSRCTLAGSVARLAGSAVVPPPGYSHLPAPSHLPPQLLHLVLLGERSPGTWRRTRPHQQPPRRPV